MTGSRAKDGTLVLAQAAEWTVGLLPKVGTWEGGRWVAGDKDELMSGCWCHGHVEMSKSPLDFGAQRLAVRCGPGRGLRRDALPPSQERTQIKKKGLGVGVPGR